jgi:hypothetical protein
LFCVYSICRRAESDKTTRELKAVAVAPEGLFGLFGLGISLLSISLSRSLSVSALCSCVFSSIDKTMASFNVLSSGYVLEVILGKFNLTLGFGLKSLNLSSLSDSSQSPEMKRRREKFIESDESKRLTLEVIGVNAPHHHTAQLLLHGISDFIGDRSGGIVGHNTCVLTGRSHFSNRL